MSEASVTVSLGRKADPEAARLARLILHRNLRVDAWSEGNLRGRLRKLLPRRTSIIIVFARHSSAAAASLIEVSGPQRMPPAELLTYVGRTGLPPAFLFLVIGQDADPKAMVDDIAQRGDAIVACCARESQALAIVALGCEFSRWWGLRSLTRERVTFAYLAQQLEVFVDALNQMLPPEGKVAVANSMRTAGDAWIGGDVVLRAVDYEKIVDGARHEQIADTLKRLADAAFAPRNLAQDLDMHAISTQALFWFTEVDQRMLDFDWLPGTRFAFDLLGPSAARPSTTPSLVPASLATHIVQDFFEQFVAVSAGTYRVGAVEGSESEPPAHSLQVTMDAYKILRRPVTRGDWANFTSSPVDGEGDVTVPVTHCNAFEALAFAHLVDVAFRDAGLISPDDMVRLPTEREWEVAASGPDGLEYPWGRTFDPNLANCEMRIGAPSPVGAFSPQGDSHWGCQDMAGNVREWTSTYGGVQGIDWQDSHTQELRDLSSLRPTDRLIVRGGSYSYDDQCVRTWMRNTQLAERSDRQTGFRLVIARRQR